MGRIDMELELTGLATLASKLNLDCPESFENPRSIARYQEYPFARFNHDEDQPDVIDKNSVEYRVRLAKVIRALDNAYEKTYTKYQARKADYIAELEADEQRMWNRYILDPAYKKSPIEGTKITGFDRISFHDTFVKETPDYSDLQDLQCQVYYIGRLLRIGRMEKARLDGSDSFVYLRNEWANMAGNKFDDVSVDSNLDDGSQAWSRSTFHNAIYD
ncbi:hypothetical protein FVEN_g2387 [Fusarium venenatum]|uniref:Uncharacterized protein n=1 Tax=Fusarium venenatum TaxID=56646 RepID=A0A2L2SU85_9HYPO|nr:uncharacterized protein FVRRES_05410 [Fusarium venenatum]KAG8359682.1 hypothetical protein FVEN_g2387 [Fusarium venenatum]CEI60974.1 unnamed protein product [Fusarium venenatum]